MAETFSYYPNKKYIERKWAPERVSLSDLMALAQAQKLATQNGVLPQDLADMMLPIAMTEGRMSQYVDGYEVPGDFGINTYAYPPSQERDARFSRLGLRVGTTAANPPPELATDQELEAWDKARKQEEKNVDVFPSSDRQSYLFDSENPSIAARMAAAMLAEKAAQFGPENAVERWNGNGKRVVNGKTVADSANHKRKVGEMMQMLRDPANAKIWNTYQGLLK